MVELESKAAHLGQVDTITATVLLDLQKAHCLVLYHTAACAKSTSLYANIVRD